jgi:hemolysin III
VPAATVLAARAGVAWAPFAVFGASMALLYLASAAYHAVRVPPAALRRWRQLDHSAIFVFIAGTYTPVVWLGLSGAWRTGVLGAVWGLAGLGVGLKLWTMGLPRLVSTLLYLGMGWLAVLIWPQLSRALPPAVLGWLLAGGLLYTAGAIVYATKRLDPWPGVFGFHEVWHLFVLAGSSAHAVAMLKLLEAGPA